MTRVAPIEERWGWLVAKLIEEADELAQAKTDEERVEELGDVLEVVAALHRLAGPDQVTAVRTHKAVLKGAFDQFIILESV